jgi:nicotinamidase/pyrazinamidase
MMNLLKKFEEQVSDTALIIVDMQNDFVEGGTLAVPGGRALVPIVNRIISELGRTALVVTSQDWHPVNAAHFDRWPVHCVANTRGAELVEGLKLPDNAIHIVKGTSGSDDGYSAFEGHEQDRGGETLEHILREHDIRDILICGIATDYCVKATALDAVNFKYHTTLITNACVGVSHSTTEAALKEMAAEEVAMMQVQ